MNIFIQNSLIYSGQALLINCMLLFEAWQFKSPSTKFWCPSNMHATEEMNQNQKWKQSVNISKCKIWRKWSMKSHIDKF